jgi:hypothetical protein
MADLDVQPKHRRPWWPWLLLLVVVLAAIFLFARDDEYARPATADPEAAGVTDTAAAP